MAIRFRCPGCAKVLRAPSSLAGKKLKCPSCGGVTRLATSFAGVMNNAATNGVDGTAVGQQLVSLGHSAMRLAPNTRPQGTLRADTPRLPQRNSQKSLEPWQLVLGLVVSAPLILPLLAELIGAVLLRAACSVSKVPEPSLGRAWWISFLSLAATLPVRIVLAVMVAAGGLPPVVDLLLGTAVSMFIVAGIYQATMSISYGEGLCLWLLQLLFLSPLAVVLFILTQMA